MFCANSRNTLGAFRAVSRLGTDTALAGNQLAVFTDAREIDADLMQALAKELNFSETTFLLPAEQGGTARVRIFNPFEEMRFAGHPVLGSAWVLAQPAVTAVVVGPRSPAQLEPACEALELDLSDADRERLAGLFA